MQCGKFASPYAIVYLIIFFGVEYLINGISYHLDKSFSSTDNTEIKIWHASFESLGSKDEKYRISSRQQWMAQMEEKYKNTRSRIYEVCQRYGKKRGMWKKGRDALMKKHISNSAVFMFDKIHKLTFCQLPKVGTSTWMTHFLNILKGLENMTQSEIAEHVRDRYLIQSQFEIPVKLQKANSGKGKWSFLNSFNSYVKTNDYLTFAFVRHPFERLVSFYKSEILRSYGKPMKIFGYEKWYNYNHTFPSFANLVLESWRKDECYGIYSFPCLNVNQHWRPINSQCLYCDVFYDVIGKMDTFSEDVKYIFLKANLTELVHVSSKVVHSSKDLQMNTDKKNETLVYFSQLSKSQVEGLYKMYSIDFEMFSFETKSYFTHLET